MPIRLDCSVIDVDASGITDCLLLDEQGLKAIETISGEVIWHVHSHDVRQIVQFLSFPVKLPDYNNDKINELLSIHRGRSLILICGKTGSALSSINIEFCQEINNLSSKNNNIIFSCSKDGESTMMKVSFDKIWSKFKNASFVVIPTELKKPITKDNIYIIGTRKLIINNDGVCPNCRGTIELKETNSKKIDFWAYNNASIMTPKIFHFQPTKANLELFKGHINGFILKIWHWSSDPKQSIQKRTVDSKNTTYFINTISERVVLITFNDTNIHVINASLSEINQICFARIEEYICQPDIKSQEKSISVGDLDQDGSQELISYSSSYVIKEDSLNWMLVSSIKVIRLEAELPKLYEEK